MNRRPPFSAVRRADGRLLLVAGSAVFIALCALAQDMTKEEDD